MDVRPIEFGLKDLAAAIRTKAMIDKETAVGKGIVSMIVGGKTLEEATEIANKAYAVRTQSR